MKKYIVKYKDSEKVFGEYSSRVEASFKVEEYINDFNDGLEGDYVSPFDFELEEVECNDVNEVITDFESARRALGFNSNSDFTVVKRSHYENTIQLKDVTKLVNEINPKHIEALIALNELFTIAEAWNKEDKFVPDFSDWYQYKWYPWFKYDKDAAGFVFADTNNTPTRANASVGSRLCFISSARAAQFGKKFTDLYNKVFLARPISNLEVKGKELGRPNFKIKGKE